MNEIVVIEEKNVKNVVIDGTNLSLSGEIIRDGEGMLRSFSARVRNNEDAELYVGDVYYSKNNDERNSVTSYVNVLEDWYMETLELFTTSIRQIIENK